MRIFSRFTSLVTTVLGTSILLHGMASVMIAISVVEASAFAYYKQVILFLILCSLAVSIAAFFTSNLRTLRILYIIRTLLLAATSYSADSHLFLILMLLVPFILETSIYEPWPQNLVLGLLAVMSSHLFLIEKGGVISGLLPMVLVNTLFVVCASLGSRYREVMLVHKDQLESIHDSIDDISRTSLEYMELASRAGEISTKAERQRITRDLHDTIGYTFTNLIMMTEAALDLADLDQVQMKSTLRSARTQAEEGLSEVRRALYILRNKEELQVAYLSAIPKLVRLFENASKITVQSDFSNLPLTLGNDVDLALYHFVQEGLTNVFRHGKADNVDLLFLKKAMTVEIIMRDNGQGFGDVVEGIGILGMRERFGKLGGTIEAHHRAYGFELVATVTIEK